MSAPSLGQRRPSGLSVASGMMGRSSSNTGNGSGNGSGNGIPGSSVPRRSVSGDSPGGSPLGPSPRLPPAHLPLPASTAASSSVSLDRNASTSSQRSGRSERRGRGLIPSPRIHATGLPTSSGPASAASSTSGSKSSSFISSHTPKLLSRRSSEKHGVVSGLLRSGSGKDKGKGREKDRSEEPPLPSGAMEVLGSYSAGDTQEVIETDQAYMSRRHPETGRKMINQYTILHEIGHGTHGQVRLGQDMSHEMVDEDGNSRPRVAPVYVAIKMVDRVPKRKKLQTLRKGALGRTEGGKLVGESEIRKEIAIFKKMHHPNIVKMKEIIDDPDQSKIFMILEYCEGGEIAWTDRGAPALTVAETRRMFRDTLLGLEYLHHQGIIHRDIKPSNLLRASDGSVKISDFGCSHYSEALRVAANNPGPEGDRYVDDVELAKTAGSPAFFAPEMCYSGTDDDLIFSRDSLSPQSTPQHELPHFTLRPPSVAGQDTPERHRMESIPMSPGGRVIPLKPTMSNDSSRRPMSVRSHSSATTFRKEIPRLPITNAIDVWALGVTLYCLLFGRTPFDAPNEYLLMQVIPVADFEIPTTMGAERIPTAGPGSGEAIEAIDLLRRLLAKSAQHRVTLEQAKKHPFTLRGLPDPTTWLASTDPHASTFVTVSNEEVLAAIAPSISFRDKLVHGLRVFANKLHLSSNRSRSKSTSQTERLVIGADDMMPSAGPATAGAAPTTGFKVISRKSKRDESPLPSPRAESVTRNPTEPSGLTKRFSMLGVKSAEASPALHSQSSIQLGSPPLPPTIIDDTRMERKGSASSAKSGFLANRKPQHLVIPTKPQLAPLEDERSPTKMASSSDLDRFKKTQSISPPASIRRRMSDVDVISRQRAPSAASSSQHSGMMGKLQNLLHRTASGRKTRRGRGTASVASEDDHALTVASEGSPIEGLRRISVDERSTGHHSQDHDDRETFASSYSSQSHRLHSPGPSADSHLGLSGQWTSRLPSAALLPRRNSSPNTPFVRHLGAGSGVEGLQGGEEEEEDVDWHGSLSDDDDDDDFNATPGPTHRPELGKLGLSTISTAAPNFPPKWKDVLGQSSSDALPAPVAAPPDLETVLDASPPDKQDPLSGSPASNSAPILVKREQEQQVLPVSPTGSMRNRLSTSPSAIGTGSGEFGHGHGYGHGQGYGYGNGNGNGYQSGSYSSYGRSSSSARSRAGSSPYRSTFGPERARSPLGRHNEMDGIEDEGEEQRYRRGQGYGPSGPSEELSGDHVPRYSGLPPVSRLTYQPSQPTSINGSVADTSSSTSVSAASSPLRSSGSAIGSMRNNPTTPTHANINMAGAGAGAGAGVGVGPGPISPFELDPNPMGSDGLLASAILNSAHQPHVVQSHSSSGSVSHAHPHPHSHSQSHSHGRSHIEADEEGGLELSFGGSKKTRGRKGSVLRHGHGNVEGRSGSPAPSPVITSAHSPASGSPLSSALHREISAPSAN